MEVAAASLYLMQGALMVWFCRQFAPARYGGSRLGRNGLMIAWALIRECMGIWWHVEYQPVLVIMKQLVGIMLGYLCVRLFYHTYRELYIFLWATLIAVGEITLFLIVEISQLNGIVYVWYARQVEREVWDYTKFDLVIGITAPILQLISNLLFLLIYWRILKLVADKFRHKSARIGSKEMLYLAVPSFVSLAIGLLFRSMLYTMENGVPKLIYDSYPLLHLFLPLILTASLAGIVFSVMSYQDIVESNEERMNRRLLAQQVAEMQTHFQEIDRMNEANRRLRHDMKNVLAVAAGMGSDPENADSLREYLTQAGERFKDAETGFSTGNSAVDSLIYMKYHDAKQRVPEVEFNVDRFCLPAGLKIYSYDLCVILGNALDNAIEACERLCGEGKNAGRNGAQAACFIFLATYMKRSTLLIEVKNSVREAPKVLPGEEFPGTTKPDGKEHGLGMGNMKRMAARYGGMVEFTCEKNTFVLRVMLQDAEPSENEI